MNCRFCDTPLRHVFVDLAAAPPSNSYLDADGLDRPEPYYPLKLYVCERCKLVQIQEHKACDEIFSEEYAYFSSYSSSWLRHAEAYVDMIVDRLGLDERSLVLEVASNDGYLLQYMVQKGIPCLGIEPSTRTAEAAKAKGVESVTEFFGTKLARRLADEGLAPDLIIGNNVLAHVPDVRDFVQGLSLLLGKNGVVTMEFPHLMRLVDEIQFDTIYHEHFSYFSLHTVRQIFHEFGLTIFDVEELPTHGGSLRIYAGHSQNAPALAARLQELAAREQALGMAELPYYGNFQGKADRVKNDVLRFLIDQASLGKTVAGYGAAAKGNTLLNYAGIKKDLLPFVVDLSPHKQGRFLPGSHIPILPEEALREARPDFVLILPWNLKKEIMKQLDYIREWGGKFVVAVPELSIV